MISKKFADIVYHIETYFMKNNVKFRTIVIGEEDYKYEITIPSYRCGMNLFVKIVSSEVDIVISPFILDHQGKKAFLPIAEYSDDPDNITTVLTKLIQKSISNIEFFSRLIKQMSDKILKVCENDGHELEEGYENVHRITNDLHLIYYYKMTIHATGRDTDLIFVLDIGKFDYHLQSKLVEQEFIKVTNNKDLDIAYKDFENKFDRLYNQLYVPMGVYEEIIANPGKYGDNIVPFMPKNRLLLTTT